MADRRHWGMMRRIALVLFCAILLEFAGNLALHAWQERELVSTERVRRTAEQLANAVTIAGQAEPDDRAMLMHALAFEGVTFNWVPRTVITDFSHALNPLAGMRQRLVQYAPELSRHELRLNLLPSQDGKERDLVGILRLDDGSFISFRVTPYLGAPAKLTTIVALHLFLLAAVFGAALLMVRALVRPLRDLAEAADETGRDGAREFVPEGPQEVRRLASAFGAMQARLLKLTEDNTQALIAVSHDLRTPIQRMRLRASMLGDADARDAMAQDLTEMEHFIDSALSYVRSGADEQPRLVDVAALLATVVDDTADQGVNVSYRGPGSFTLETRPTTLIRMINNVLDNARRHADRIEIHLSGQEGIMAEIHIEDDGPGIPPDRRVDAVQPFRKLEAVGSPPPRKGAKHGVGLGLAYVSRTLEMQGGKLLLGKAALGGLVAILFIPATGA
jgi:signal transduction histidine kinase